MLTGEFISAKELHHEQCHCQRRYHHGRGLDLRLGLPMRVHSRRERAQRPRVVRARRAVRLPSAVRARALAGLAAPVRFDGDAFGPNGGYARIEGQAMERWRIENTDQPGVLRVVHEDQEFMDSDGEIVVSWSVDFPSPVQGSIDLLQIEAARRVLKALKDYLSGMERMLSQAHPIEPPDTTDPS